MKIEILSTGEELLSGALADTNAAWLSEKLTQNGLQVKRHQAVGDDLPIIIKVLSEIGQRADILIVTGGLGPTSDDLSAEAASKAINKPLIFFQNVYDDMCAFFKRTKRPMNPSNKKQAYLPESAQVIPNPIGTASGFKVWIDQCHTFFLPGVPSEMIRMFNNYVLPELHDLLNHSDAIKTAQQTISCFGISESLMGEKIADIPSLINGIKVGTRSKYPELQIKLYAVGKSFQQVETRLKQAENLCQDRLGEYIFSINGETIQQVVGHILRKKSDSLAIAESCTGGLIAHWITQVPGSSNYFKCGVVTYSNESKENILGVHSETIQTFGAVSLETVQEMAIGIRNKTNADYALATSGIAGPDGGTDEKPVGTLCMAVACESETYSQKIVLPFGKRSQKKEMFALAALDMLRRKLQGKNDLNYA